MGQERGEGNESEAERDERHIAGDTLRIRGERKAGETALLTSASSSSLKTPCAGRRPSIASRTEEAETMCVGETISGQGDLKISCLCYKDRRMPNYYTCTCLPITLTNFLPSTSTLIFGIDSFNLRITSVNIYIYCIH